MVSTFSTVGYGDITATTTKEMLFVIVLIMSCQLLFSFFSGSIREILLSYKILNSEKHLREKMEEHELFLMKFS
jgi:hypothetical protein